MIACLGSGRTHAARCKRMQELCIDANDLCRLKGPAGMNIGALTPSEIAVSILADDCSRAYARAPTMTAGGNRFGVVETGEF